MKLTSEVELLQTPLKSESDKKNYKLIKLSNGLKALLIGRPESEENEAAIKESCSAVCLCIDVGSFEDPLEVQGLCHFLEHMVSKLSIPISAVSLKAFLGLYGK